jgi:hypothetical protein
MGVFHSEYLTAEIWCTGGLYINVRRIYISYLMGYLKIGGPSCDGKERDPDTTHTHIGLAN